MTITEKLELIRAGYSKAEIEAMSEPEGSTAPQPEPEPEAKGPEPAPSTDLSAILTAIENLSKAVISQNIKQSEQQKGAPAGQSVDDILASIINPTIKKG